MRKVIWTSLVLSLCFVSTGAYSQEVPNKTVLTIGKSTEEIIEYQGKFAPIVRYLASKLKDVGIDQGEEDTAKEGWLAALTDAFRQRRRRSDAIDEIDDVCGRHPSHNGRRARYRQ